MASVLSGRPLATSSATASAIEAGLGDRVAHDVFVAELQALVVAGGEQREVGVEEVLGERVAHREAVLQRERAGAPLRRASLPDRRFTFLDVRLVERERREPEVDVAASAQRGDHGGVAVVRERAAVVEGDGDRTGHGGPPGVGVPAEVPAIVASSTTIPDRWAPHAGRVRASPVLVSARGRGGARPDPARRRARRRRRCRRCGASACTPGWTRPQPRARTTPAWRDRPRAAWRR